MLTLYHSPQTRSSRMIWLLEELGQPYRIEYVTIQRGDGSGERDPKNPNPVGRVPALVHDGRLVTESGAIALYLTDAFPQAKLGPGPADPLRADYLSWLFFYAAEVEPAIIHKFLDLVDKHAPLERSYGQMVDRFAGALERGPYMLGEAFSALDILYGSLVQWGGGMLPDNPAFSAYKERLAGRPAAVRAQARDAIPT